MRRFYLILTIVSACFLLIDWGPVFGLFINDSPRQKISRSISPVDSLDVADIETSNMFLLHEYENAVKEIHMRLDQESKLFTLKFSLVGAILGLLLAGFFMEKHKDIKKEHQLFVSPLAVAFCWAAIITSGVIDNRILYNNNMVISLGTWIRDYVEPKFLSSSYHGWERYFSETGSLLKSRLYPFLRLNACLLTLVLFSFVTIIYSERSNSVSSDRARLRKYCYTGSIGAIIVFSLVGIQFHYTEPIWTLYCIVIMIIGVFGACMLWRDKTYHDSAIEKKQI